MKLLSFLGNDRISRKPLDRVFTELYSVFSIQGEHLRSCHQDNEQQLIIFSLKQTETIDGKINFNPGDVRENYSCALTQTFFSGYRTVRNIGYTTVIVTCNDNIVYTMEICLNELDDNCIFKNCKPRRLTLHKLLFW